jgi:hypothetical protein
MVAGATEKAGGLLGALEHAAIPRTAIIPLRPTYLYFLMRHLLPDVGCEIQMIVHST